MVGANGQKFSSLARISAVRVPIVLRTKRRSLAAAVRAASLVRIPSTHPVLSYSWRVTEISQIILVLLDSRCPLLHYPPSLHDYLADRKVIFVLTKVDITGPTCAKAWSDFLRARYPGTRIVQVESYIQKRGDAAQGRSRLEPHIPTEFRDELVKAIKATHAALLEPPANVRSNPSRLQAWKAPVRRDINWESLTHETSINASISRQLPSMEDEQDSEGLNQVDDLEYLTIGLIGL